MPAPKSPISILADALKNTSRLKGYRGAKGNELRLLVGAKELPLSGAPPRIVLVPTNGGCQNAADTATALRDVELRLKVEVWADDVDPAWDLQQRFFQALEEQGAAEGKDEAGFYWQAISVDWDQTEDTAQQGQLVDIVIEVRFSLADRVTTSTGHVDEVGLEDEAAAVPTITITE